MNSKATNIFKNFSYTSTSNLLSLFISIIVIMIIPKLIGVEEFGYWQLYLFYSAYVGFLHFGWTDGIYLKYGGESYQNLNKNLFFSQFYMLIIMQLFIATIILISSYWFIDDNSRSFIMYMVAICMVVINVRSFPLFILQATNRIIEYAKIMMIGQLCYFSIIVLLFILGFIDFKLLILADILGKFISLFYAVYCCKDIVFRKLSVFHINFVETLENMRIGIKIMFAYIASLLIIGVVRFGIERAWDVATFGKVSLVLSISKLVMIFINALGIIIFPILRRTNRAKLSGIYKDIRDFLMVILLGLLLMYFPLKSFVTVWLPEYAESLIYLAILFPILVFEGKTALLINTYLKTLREEKLMLKINLLSLALGILLTIVTTLLLKDLDLAILSIIILLAFRSVVAEKFISVILSVSVTKDILLELILVAIFIVISWYIDSWLVIVLYLIAYILYLLLKRKDILRTIKNIKLMLKNE